MRWTAVSIDDLLDEMTMIVVSRVVRRERFLTDVTTRRTTVRLLLLFRQRFHRHIGRYDSFHTMRQIVELSRELHCTVFISTEVIRRCVVIRASYVVACTKCFMPLNRVRRCVFLGFCSYVERTPGRHRPWTALISGCYSCRIWTICCFRSAVGWRSWSSGSPLRATFRMSWSVNEGICK